jgi:hypothetical protein
MTAAEFDLGFLEPEPIDHSAAEELFAPHDPQPDETYDQPEASFVKPQSRKRNAVVYEKKLRGLLNIPFRAAVEHKTTVPDAAAIAMYGPAVCTAWGDAAAADDRIAKAIDFVTMPSENPLTAAVIATVPFFFQILRNHEIEPQTRGIKIPFTKGKRIFKIRFGIKLRRLRALTNDPQAFADHVFSNPAMRDSLKKQGINVAGYDR